MTDEIVWRGPEPLRPFLVAVEDFEPFPGNPRRGEVESLRESLREFGQPRPVLTDPNLGADGKHRLVAGHHLRLAAIAEGWTHLAAIPNAFESEEQARRFLVADNRLPELGGYDDVALLEQLAAIRDLKGTGYTEQDRSDLAARLAAIRQPVFAPSPEPPPALDERSGTTGIFEVPLYLDKDTRHDFANLVGMLKREWSIDETTGVVLRALREAAERA